MTTFAELNRGRSSVQGYSNDNLIQQIIAVIKECDGGPYWICCSRKMWLICNQDGTQLEEYRDPAQCEDRCEAMNNEFIARKIVEFLNAK